MSEEQAVQVKRSWESKSIDLQGAINSLQNQLSEARKIKDSSSNEGSQRLQMLEEQFRTTVLQKDQEIFTLKSTLSLLEGQIYEIKSSYELQMT
jgi:hypothetical protein